MPNQTILKVLTRTNERCFKLTTSIDLFKDVKLIACYLSLVLDWGGENQPTGLKPFYFANS